MSRASLHPVDRLGTREAIIARAGAQAFTDWIPPDVAGDVFDRFAASEDVVVVAALPQALVSSLHEFVGRALLELVDELYQVSGVSLSLGQKVEMVRHDAISVKREVVDLRER